jgi:hypothetical protein
LASKARFGSEGSAFYLPIVAQADMRLRALVQAI